MLSKCSALGLPRTPLPKPISETEEMFPPGQALRTMYYLNEVQKSQSFTLYEMVRYRRVRFNSIGDRIPSPARHKNR